MLGQETAALLTLPPAGRKLLDPTPPNDPIVSNVDIFTKFDQEVGKLEQEKAKKPADSASGTAANAGRKLLADPVAPITPTVSDIDLFTKYSDMAAKIEQERAVQESARRLAATAPQQGGGRHLLDVVTPKDPTVYDTTSHQFDVLQEFAQKVEQEKAKQQPAQPSNTSP